MIDLITGETAEKLRADLDFQKMMADKQAQEASKFYEFLSETEKTAREMPKIVQIIRGLVRPLITYATMGLTGFLLYMNVMEGKPITDQAFSLLKIIDAIIIGFWFAGHGWERIVEKMGENGKGKSPFKNKIS